MNVNRIADAQRQPARANIVLLNKPYGVLSQFTDRDGRRTLAEFGFDRDLRVAGRLDLDSEGLLVLTDSGALNQKITNPQHKVSKTYFVQVEGEPDEDALGPLRDGIELPDGPCAPARCNLETPDWLWPREPPIRVRRNIPTRWLRITISEGRNRQVRRMCAAIGFPVLRLVRYRVASWTLDGVNCGEWRRV